MDTWHHEHNPEGSTVEMHGNIRSVMARRNQQSTRCRSPCVLVQEPLGAGAGAPGSVVPAPAHRGSCNKQCDASCDCGRMMRRLLCRLSCVVCAVLCWALLPQLRGVPLLPRRGAADRASHGDNEGV